jgi:D-3-phosphoglycerate dehydrogenase
MLTVRAFSGANYREVCGTVYGKDEVRIVHIDGFRVNIKPFGAMIVTEHNDRPGIIGKVGTLLGENHINIGGMHVGRAGIGQRAMMVLVIDEPVSDELVETIRTVAGMETARQVQL